VFGDPATKTARKAPLAGGAIVGEITLLQTNLTARIEDRSAFGMDVCWESEIYEHFGAVALKKAVSGIDRTAAVEEATATAPKRFDQPGYELCRELRDIGPESGSQKDEIPSVVEDSCTREVAAVCHGQIDQRKR
jgi:hypothetical protein